VKTIQRIRLEDGPEDGLELTPAILRKLIGAEDYGGSEISLFMQPEMSGRGTPYLLGRYLLAGIVEGTATYRWQPR
jgi:hypothetical protein